MEVLKEIEAKKQELRETNYQLKAEQRTLGEVKKKFKETKERYQSLLDEKEKSLSGLTMQILNQWLGQLFYFNNLFIAQVAIFKTSSVEVLWLEVPIAIFLNC